jgi:hypothetical protein
LAVHRIHVAVTVTVEQSMTSSVPTPACPKCGSTNVKSVPVKRSSVPEAVAAEYFRGTTGPQGADTILQGVCRRCGCRWTPRTTEERHLRALSGQLGSEAARAAEAGDAARGKSRPWNKLAKRKNRSTIVLVVLLILWVIGLLI